MQRADRDGEFRHVLGVRHAQAVLSHVLDMRGPGIDIGHVLAGLNHVGAGISADRARSDKDNFFLAMISSRPERSAAGAPITTPNPD